MQPRNHREDRKACCEASCGVTPSPRAAVAITVTPETLKDYVVCAAFGILTAWPPSTVEERVDCDDDA